MARTNTRSGPTRLFPTSKLTASPFTLTAGFQAAPTDARAKIFPLNGMRRAIVNVLCIGADNDTMTIEVWGVSRCNSDLGVLGKLVKAQCIGTLVATIGTAVGRSSTPEVLDTEMIADGMTWTDSTVATSPKGPSAVAASVFGGNGDGPNDVYSPADNTCADLMLSNLDRFDGLIFRVASKTGTATSYNILVSTFDK